MATASFTSSRAFTETKRNRSKTVQRHEHRRDGLCESLETRLAMTAGATVPYTTYEAESGTYTGTLLSTSYAQNTVAGESSGRQAVRLSSTGESAQVSAAAAANSVVVRYSIPDSSTGGGQDATLGLYINGVFSQELNVTSKYSWQYGTYPFTNTPSSGSPRNFYDEVRVKGLTIHAGDTVRVQRTASDTAATYDIDLIDLENVAAPLTQPVNSINVTSVPYSAAGNGTTDDTTAIQTAVNDAIAQHKTVWVPSGNYKITNFITGIHDVTIQGAGMWYTNFVGDPTVDNNTAAPTRRVGFDGSGSNVHLTDFAITGALNYRGDSEANDGIGGSFGSGSTISNLWIEHTKVGMWLINSTGLTVSNSRIRDTLADGINLSVGMRANTVSNCATRGTGDDCFAIFPATYTSQTYAPGLNVITQCTGIEPYLANGGAIYGGDSNSIDNSLFKDINYGSGVLISTTFNVGTNLFAGTTVVRDSTLLRTGGSTTLAAVEFADDLNAITGVSLSNLTLTDNAYNGLGVKKSKALTNVTATGLNIGATGLAGGTSYGVFVDSVCTGGLAISNSVVPDYNNTAPKFALTFANTTSSLPTPWLGGDINSASVKGSSSYTAGTFTVAGAGTGIRSAADGFRFVSQSVSGDHTISASVDSLQNTNTSPLAGLMFRNEHVDRLAVRRRVRLPDGRHHLPAPQHIRRLDHNDDRHRHHRPGAIKTPTRRQCLQRLLQHERRCHLDPDRRGRDRCFEYECVRRHGGDVVQQSADSDRGIQQRQRDLTEAHSAFLRKAKAPAARRGLLT